MLAKFSVTKCLLTENEKEDSIVGQRIVCDALKYYGGFRNVKVTLKMLTAVRSARKKYEQYQEKVKDNKKYKKTMVQIF